MGVFYFSDWNETSTEKVYRIAVTPIVGLFLFHTPSECIMFIPGTYAEMLKDYE
jgi:hypothetical protein